MKRFLPLLFFPLMGWGQVYYTVTKATSLSGAAEVITVQQPTSGSKTVEFKSAYVDCSVPCTVTLERSGTPASGTALTPAATSPNRPAAKFAAFYSSNVGSGTTLSTVSIGAGEYRVFDLTGINLDSDNNNTYNFTIRTSSITGNVNIIIKCTER